MRELSLDTGLLAGSDAAPPLLPVHARALCFAAGGVAIIDGADFTLHAGGCTVIMGYNGAGKSVLLRLLHGLLTPTGGSLEWAAKLTPKTLVQRQAMVFQTPVVLRRTVADNVRYALRAHGVHRKDCAERVARLLAAGELSHLADRSAAVLSGGERQRLAVVRAMSTEPEIMFLDEPTASLDPASARTVERLIALARDRGTKIVLVTQSVPQARRLARDVLFLHEGRVLEHQAAEHFFAGPASAPARAFIAGRFDP